MASAQKVRPTCRQRKTNRKCFQFHRSQTSPPFPKFVSPFYFYHFHADSEGGGWGLSSWIIQHPISRRTSSAVASKCHSLCFSFSFYAQIVFQKEKNIRNALHLIVVVYAPWVVACNVRSLCVSTAPSPSVSSQSQIYIQRYERERVQVICFTLFASCGYIVVLMRYTANRFIGPSLVFLLLLLLLFFLFFSLHTKNEIHSAL